MPIVDRVAKVFSKVFDFDSQRFSLEATPETVPNWDSVGHMNLVAQLETEFGLQFEVDDIMEMSSAAKVVEILKARGVADT
jgi:acyl carrier protein